MSLKQWRRPREYRSIIAYNPRGIYQVDVMHLYPLWDRMFNSFFKEFYKVPDYALVCVDVYSRYVMAVGIYSESYSQVKDGLYYFITVMGRPDIISGDNKIIDALYIKIGNINVIDPRFTGIRTYATSPGETNKNAIVERMIRTLKDMILKILQEHDPVDIYYYYSSKGYKYTLANALLLLACHYINNRVNRTTKNKPIDIFRGLVRNEQEIKDVDYPLYSERTVVLKIPERRGQVPLKTFNYDVEPYVIVLRAGRKYALQKMIDWIRGIPYFDATTRAKEKLYKPYEIRPFKSTEELLEHLNKPLVKRTLVKDEKYGLLGYNSLVNWIKTHMT